MSLEHIAQSTLALSCFNALATLNRPACAAELVSFLREHWGEPVELDHVEASIEQLVTRGYARRIETLVDIVPGPTGHREMVRTRSETANEGWW